MRGRNISFPRLVLFTLGGIFLASGLGLAIIGTRQAADAAARAERLTPLTAARLEDMAPGQEALLEGRVSERNRALFRQFVSYIREEYRGSDDDDNEQWNEDERRTPPLLLRLNDGLVEISNDSYDLLSPAQFWQEPGGLYWNGFSGEGTKRYSGLAAGDTVTAVGRIVAGREGPALAAEFVFGGDRAAYIQAKRDDQAFMPWFGAIFATVGALLIGFGSWRFLRW